MCATTPSRTRTCRLRFFAPRRALALPAQSPCCLNSVESEPTIDLRGDLLGGNRKQGNIYVRHRPIDADPIVVLNPTGKVLRSWGKGMFKIPHSMRIDAAGNVWTVDASTSIVYKFSSKGEKLLQITVGGVPRSTQDFCGASDVAFTPGGHVFVTDGYCNSRVIEYDSRGRKVRQWGRRGAGPGKFNLAHAIAVDTNGNLYIADRENGRLQWFSVDGKFLGQWKYGGQLYNVAFNTAGELYVSTHPKDVSLDEEFDVVKIDPATGRMLGHVQVRSHELAIGPDGTLFPATRSSHLILFRQQNIEQ